MIYKVSYNTLKTYSNTSSIPLKWLEESSAYTVFLIDNGVVFETTIDRSSSSAADLTDFETNIKPIVIQPYSQLDTDGANIIRVKAAKRGWSFWAAPVEITTSTLSGNLFFQDYNGNNITWTSCKIYDGSDIEITTAGTLNANYWYLFG